MKILALIPARSGSKGIINKNIMDYNGKPMIYMSIKNALESKYNTNNNMRIIVSIDSQEYKDISLKYGEVLFYDQKKYQMTYQMIMNLQFIC